jgi:hypothetical protein
VGDIMFSSCSARPCAVGGAGLMVWGCTRGALLRQPTKVIGRHCGHFTQTGHIPSHSGGAAATFAGW